MICLYLGSLISYSKVFCTSDGAMDLTFQISYVAREITQKLRHKFSEFFWDSLLLYHLQAFCVLSLYYLHASCLLSWSFKILEHLGDLQNDARGAINLVLNWRFWNIQIRTKSKICKNKHILKTFLMIMNNVCIKHPNCKYPIII